MAREKAAAVAARHDAGLVLAADTVVAAAGVFSANPQIMPKPKPSSSCCRGGGIR